jgi:Domain of unknown function (DUF4157)/A nuclease family of the HNH/ENDO VII superfamily with conserved AHH
MKTAEAKISSNAVHLQKKTDQPFFNKRGGDQFFSSSIETPHSFFKSTTVQPKLTIGQPNDKYEQEADAMADKVVQRLATPDVLTKKETAVQAKPIVTAITPLVQAKCATCEPTFAKASAGKEDKLQMKEEEDLVQESPLDLQLKPIFESNAEPPDDNSLTVGKDRSEVVQRKCAACEQEDKLQKKEEEDLVQESPLELQRKPIFESNAEPPDDESLSIGKDRGEVVQRKCAACEQEDKLQKKEEEDLVEESPLELQRKPIFESNAEPPDDENNVHRKCAECEKEEQVQKKSDFSDSSSASSSIENSLNSSKGGGSSIPEGTREQMESSLGADFSNVRLHSDSSAVQMNKDLNAQAFAHGNDIYFNSGKYDTNSTSGKHLLAHELTHTIQQTNSIGLKIIQKTPLAEFNERYPELIDTISQISTEIRIYLEDFDYGNSSVINRTDVIRHEGMSYNLRRINQSFPEAQRLFFLSDESFVDELIANRVNEGLTYRWLQLSRNLIHHLRGLALAEYVYPQFPSSHTFGREIPFSLQTIIGRIAGLGSHPFIQSYGTVLRDSVDAERATEQETESETRTVSIEQTIRHVRQYVRRYLSGILNNEHPNIWYSLAISELLRQDLGVDSARYLEFFRELRSQSTEFLQLISFEGRLLIDLSHLNIHGLDDIAELRGEGTQFTYHMILGSWNLDEETGEEHDAPGIALLFDVIVGIVPGLGQIADARDITGYIYRLGKYDSQRSSWGTWIGLIGSLVGLAPVAGDAAKSIIAGLRRGLSEMPVGSMSETIVQGITRLIDRRYLELLLDSSDTLTRNLTVRWTVIQRRVLNKWDEILSASEPYLVRLTDLTAAQIASLRAAAQEILPLRLQETGTLLRQVIMSLARNTAEEIREIMRGVRSLSADGRLANALEDFERMEREALEALERGAAQEADEILENMRRMNNEENIPSTRGPSEELEPSDTIGHETTSEAQGDIVNDTDILESTRRVQGTPLTDEQLNIEIDALRSRSPRASTEPGYEFEIELPNGHTWRRSSDGRWCRFTGEFCYTEGAIPPHLRDILEDIAERQPYDLSIYEDVPIRTGIPEEIGGRQSLFQTARSSLRRRMNTPSWANATLRGGGWEAHHIIPWEFRRHSLFDILRENGGWDHNSLLNAIALPTSEEIRLANSLNLPTHQAYSRATRGHGVYNWQISQRLDLLVENFELDPSALREGIERLIEELRAGFPGLSILL